MRWVKAHVGIKGKKRTELAKETAIERTNNKELKRKIATSRYGKTNSEMYTRHGSKEEGQEFGQGSSATADSIRRV